MSGYPRGPFRAIDRNRFAFAIAALIVLGCADTAIAPRADQLTRLNAPVAHDRGACTISWLAPVSGLWTDAARWSTATVPGASDEVCITVDGTYTVTARGAQTVFGLRVGVDGNAGVQTLNVQGAPGIAALLTVQDGIENRGVLRVDGAGNGAGSCTLAVSNVGLHNLPAGLVEMQGGCSSPGTAIAADVLNEGRFEVEGIVQLNRTDGRFVNTGNFIVVQPQQVQLLNNQTFVQADGTLTNNQPNGFLLTGGVFEWNGGAIINQNPRLNGTALRIGEGSTGVGQVTIHGASTLTGDPLPGQIILIQGVGNPGAASLTTTAATTNHGIIRLAGAGIGAQACTLIGANGGLTNASDGRIETLNGCGVIPTLSGDIVNLGTINVGAVQSAIRDGTLRHHASGSITGGQLLRIESTGVLYADGSVDANIRNIGQFHVGHSPGLFSVAGTFLQEASGTLNIELGGTVPGVDFDRAAFAGSATLSGTLNLNAADGTCVDPGVYEFLTYSARAGDFATVNVSNLGAGHTLTRQPAATNYRVTVSGPSCAVPDQTPPIVTPNVEGPLGNNDWYVGNVTVSWQVSDAESAISSHTGCTESQVTDDTAGITFTCSATSAGGNTSQSVTIKRDATAPAVSATRAPAANGNGWNNTDVTATYSATDAMSGIDGSASATQTFSAEGAGQGGSHIFADLAGNTATALISDISIDKTAPEVGVSRQPSPDADGWNTTAVTVIYSAIDALSGILGDASVPQVFANEGTNQGGSHEFADLAGNTATATISGINIRRPLPPPPPPQPLAITCSATPSELWPPNGQMVPVAVTIQSSSDLTGGTIRLLSATSNEPNSGPDADIQEFTIGTNDLSGLLRAARRGSGNGRRYALVYEVTTSDEQRAECTVIVSVLHDQGKRPR
jgi:hypothetical protein